MSEPHRIWATPPVFGKSAGTYFTFDPENPAANAREFIRAPSPELVEQAKVTLAAYRNAQADTVKVEIEAAREMFHALLDLLEHYEGTDQ